MARPRLSEGGTERLHMVISADEMAAIEDWRYAHRVPSKSEAIRRLCQIGITAESEIDPLVKKAEHVMRELIFVGDLIEIGKAPKGMASSWFEAALSLADALQYAFSIQAATTVLGDSEDKSDIPDLIKKAKPKAKAMNDQLK